jgi:hypothetical protein
MTSRSGSLFALALAGLLASCGGDNSANNPTGTGRVAPSSSVVYRFGGKPCRVTLPNGRTPPGERSSRENHGNGLLWTVLWPSGKILATHQFVERGGSIRMKFPWWGSREAKGRLKITGHRLDHSARPLRAPVLRGYTSAPHFWASSIIFPTEGCWEITGKTRNASLTFVTLVLKTG